MTAPKDMKFDELCNKAARDLPEGWTLTITLERGCGDIELEPPEGPMVLIEDGTLAEKVDVAIKVARDEV